MGFLHCQGSLKVGLAIRCRAPFLAAVLLGACFTWIPAAAQQASPGGNDVPKEFHVPTDGYDHIRREVMIPMRDGVKLFTSIVIPKGAHDAPILLTRTPYNAFGRTRRNHSPLMLSTLPQGDEVFVQAGYIRVFQDVRGKHKSEGDYVMTRPVRGPLNPASTDHVTDAYDTIDWLVKNVPESNGRVGMLGSSYEGFTVVMALLGPHPALKVAAPESPMVDGWMGDDWFHYGAFRQTNYDYTAGQTSSRGGGDGIDRGYYDDFESFLRAGSSGAYARKYGLDQLPWVQKMTEHPAYDEFWQGQALDKLVAERPSSIPTMWIQGLWDQEDMWGAIHCYLSLKAKGQAGHNYLVMGPWRHSQVNYDAYNLGPLKWQGDTATEFRRDVLLPFFNQYLKAGAPQADTPPIFIYNTGENHWDRLKNWPLACESGCAAPMKPIYLQAGSALAFDKPSQAAASDSYVSDPAKPIPYLPRPVRFADGERWRQWLIWDQRFVVDRPDVLVYETEKLTAPMRISGAPIADLYAATTGTDADWVVKLIDVYPDEVPSYPEMGGYQLAVSMDIFRGRYRDSFERPSPIPAGKTQRYRFVLPTANHVFLPGHRVMVQIQSSWFPLYDRNPQTYVSNIFMAQPADYVKATQSIFRSAEASSAVWLPLVP
ncbi:CocE/NonD family hydrolase [Paludibaculum fermentans]|uniref:CocE/NonD family hydrolase n=1 Tax=Paludibaculum fermentans TaxID=1473598 RepID=A0A7S7NVF9_PALFE|nr:CocE/NonD family hydrolase [Paludibaculum fermentans]QOY90448.1 CocE/NonD family hydrolase [Paludibaculum fermentans]